MAVLESNIPVREAQVVSDNSEVMTMNKKFWQGILTGVLLGLALWTIIILGVKEWLA